MTGGRISVLKEHEVRLIHEDRRSYRDIAITYGISAMTVSNIKSGRAWKHLGLRPTTRGRTRQSYPRTKGDGHNGSNPTDTVQ